MTLTYGTIEAVTERVEKVLAEPPLKLVASGGGMKTETGSDTQELVLDTAVILPRLLVEELVAVLKDIQLVPA